MLGDSNGLYLPVPLMAAPVNFYICFEVASGAPKRLEISYYYTTEHQTKYHSGTDGRIPVTPPPPTLCMKLWSLTACAGNALSRAGTMPLNSPRTPSALTWGGGGGRGGEGEEY